MISLKNIGLPFSLLLICSSAFSQERKGDPALTEIWEPEPAIVQSGKTPASAPSDAIILFDGSNTSAWKSNNGGDIAWKNENGILTVTPGSGQIVTKEGFGDCQLHIEWRTPSVVKGEGQGRGNSGIFLMSKFELQVLDSYNNRTYSNGQAGSIYKQTSPLVNASKAPGEWQTYDIVFTAPRFNEKGGLIMPARITVIHNGVLIQNNTSIWGGTEYIGLPVYGKMNAKEPIILQDHGNPVSFRNIWIRPL